MRSHLVALAMLVAACRREHQANDGERREDSANHEHEPGHGEVATRVRLSEAVVVDAGIAWEPVQRRPIARTIRLPGEVVADPGRRARIGARLPGIVESLPIEPGARVAKGAVIAVVRAPDVQSLRADAASLRARATSARANATRLAELAKTRMASAQEVIAAQAEADALEAQAGGARDRLKAIGLTGKHARKATLFEVVTPIDGVLVERAVVEGDPVTPETVLGTVVALDELWFLARVFERDVARVHEQARAAVQLNAFPDERFPGVVEYLAHQVDPGARTVTARIPIKNDDGRLRIGLFGIASVAVGPPDAAPVLAVPHSAVTNMLGDAVVFVRHDDGDFERHEVSLGESDPDFVEVLHGLREGELVVTEGTFAIKSVMLRATFGEDEH